MGPYIECPYCGFTYPALDSDDFLDEFDVVKEFQKFDLYCPSCNQLMEINVSNEIIIDTVSRMRQ